MPQVQVVADIADVADVADVKTGTFRPPIHILVTNRVYVLPFLGTSDREVLLW